MKILKVTQLGTEDSVMKREHNVNPGGFPSLPL